MLAHRWVRHLLASCLFAAVATIFLWPAVSRQAIYTTAANTQSITLPWALDWDGFVPVVQSDESHLSRPQHTVFTRSIRGEGPSGERALAFWNPHSFAGGAPLFANGHIGQLSPVRLLNALLVSPTTAHELSSWFHLTAAGISMYLLGRSFGMRYAGSIAAGLAWQCSGFVLAWLHVEVVTPTFAFAPLVVAFVHLAVRRRRPADILGAVLAGTLLVVSGHVLFTAVTMLVAYGYATALCLESLRQPSHPWRLVGRRAVVVGITAAATLGLSAAMVIPTALELRDSPRAPVTVDALTREGVAQPGEVFLRVAWPDSVPLDADEIHFQPFVGLLGAVLAATGFLLRGRRGSGLARTLVVVGLLAALDGPLLRILRFLPVFNIFRPYGRLSLWVVLGLAVLIGHAVDELTRHLRARWGPGLAYGAVALLVVANTSHQLTWGRAVNDTFWPRDPEYVFPTRPILDEALAARTNSGWPVMVAPITRAEPGDAFYPDMLGSELHAIFGLDTPNGYEASVPTRTSQLLRVLAGEPVESVLDNPGRAGAERPRYVSARVRWDLLDRIGVGLVMLSPFLDPADPTWGAPGRADALGLERYRGRDGILIEVTGWGSGPQLVGNTEVVPSDAEALVRFTDSAFPYRERVVITAAAARDVEGFPNGNGAGTVVAAGRDTNTAWVEVEASDEVWLVVPINWHPGWAVTVDGRPAAAVRANATRLAVPLGPGVHRVDLRFTPPGLWLGAVVSAATAASLVAASVGCWRRRRQAAVASRRASS